MIQRVKCRFGLHFWTKWLPGQVTHYRVEARSCVRCGTIHARFPEEQTAAREVRE